jgi:hypothetical protein
VRGAKLILLVIFLAVSAAGLFWYVSRQREIAREREKILADQRRQELLLVNSGVPGYWIRTALDSETRILEGETISTDLALVRRLKFSTTDSAKLEVKAYQDFATAQGWKIDGIQNYTDGMIVFSVDLGKMGALTIHITPQQAGSAVELRRLIKP